MADALLRAGLIGFTGWSNRWASDLQRQLAHATRTRDWAGVLAAASDLHALLPWPRFLGDMGLALIQLERPDEAVACFDRCIEAVERGAYQASEEGLRFATLDRWHQHRAMALTYAGRWRDAVMEVEHWYASRPTWFREHFACDLPRWEYGQPLDGRSVLVVQGNIKAGECIQWARFLPALATRARVTMLLPPELAGLRPILEPLVPVAAEAEAPGLGADCWLPIETGLRIFADENVPPPGGPYLRAVGTGRDALKIARTGFLVAWCWAGARDDFFDAERNLPPSRWRPTLTAPGIQVVSVQVGRGPAPRGVLDLGPELRDFNDTAHVLAQADLVITVDTSIAHLAGALGRPTWILLRKGGDGRWGYRGDRTEWYDSARLFRQEHYGDWMSVLRHVAHELRHIAARAAA